MAILSEISPEQVEVIKAIGNLLKASGLDAVRRAYGHAIQGELLNWWAKELGLKRSPGQVCIRRLLGKPGLSLSCLPPRTDHASLWLKDGKPYCIVSKPYGPLSMSKLEEIGEFCRRHGLEFKVDTWPAWHFPHAVLFITFKKAEGASNGSDLSRG